MNPNKSNLDPDLGFFSHFGSGPRAMITILEKNVLNKDSDEKLFFLKQRNRK